MSDEICANCGHSDHTDGINGDSCFKLTSGGLCGCQKWEPHIEDDPYDEWADERLEREEAQREAQ